jgi:hypothetical protein
MTIKFDKTGFIFASEIANLVSEVCEVTDVPPLKGLVCRDSKIEARQAGVDFVNDGKTTPKMIVNALCGAGPNSKRLVPKTVKTFYSLPTPKFTNAVSDDGKVFVGLKKFDNNGLACARADVMFSP